MSPKDQIASANRIFGHQDMSPGYTTRSINQSPSTSDHEIIKHKDPTNSMSELARQLFHENDTSELES